MKHATATFALAILFSWLLFACAPNERPLNFTGNILLWHRWNEDDALLLDQVLDQVTEIAPGTSVITVFVPDDELLERYIVATEQGVGPDILLGSSEWVRSLVDAKVIRPADFDERELYQYAPTALQALRYTDVDGGAELYGYPLSLYPDALYRNTQLTSTSPSSLDELLALAQNGESIAIVPRFQPAYWGIQAFGDGLFDTSGRFTLTTSGFTEWLTWLSAVQQEPGIILNVDREALEEMYMDGRVSYFVAGPQDLRHLTESVGVNGVDVSPLPSGPAGPAGPLLPVEAAMLSTISSPDQAVTASAVASFLANPQQSTTFMRESGRIPANRLVEVDARVYPVLSGFALQSETAVTLPNELKREEFYLLGDRAYANAITGVLTPEEAVCEFGLAVAELQGYDENEVDLPEDCVATGEVD